MASVDRVEDLPDCWQPPDGYTTERLAADLAFVREQLADYRRQEKDLEAAIAERMRGQQEHPGPWRIERRWSSSRVWQSDTVMSDLFRAARFDPETGEERDPAAALRRFAEMVRECVPCTASLGWRIGGQPGHRGLRDWGLDPDEYSEKGTGSWRVTVTYDPEGPT